ncbi:MAG TPA: hypothetical protein VFA69_04775 [Candidatus Nitrosotalea sp.]|nr:hypothetical protein [Candidatus Nitrosotalea sp.]
MKTLHLSIITILGITLIISLGIIFLLTAQPMRQSVSQSISDDIFSSLPVIHPQRCEAYQNNMICHGMNMEIDNQNRNMMNLRHMITQTGQWRWIT